MKDAPNGVRRPRPATIIATLALFIALGGTAAAAGVLIDGKKIKKGTITAKQIKNKTITKAKLSPSTVKALKGQAGVTGRTGAIGTKGATGAAGANGVIAPFHAESDYMPLPEESVLLTIDLPAGQYMLSAKANLTSTLASASVACAVWVDQESAVDQALADPVGANETVPLSLMAIAEVGERIELRCNGNEVTGNARDVKLIALPIS